MEYRQLGSTEMRVSALAAGGYPFGPPLLDQDETTRVIHQALGVGINFFDTSDVYGDGQSEDFIGNALVGERNQVYLSTKFNLLNLDGLSVADRITARCDEALRKLKTDYIDLFQVHFATSQTLHEELLRPLNDLIQAGKVRYIGNCNTASWRFSEELEVASRSRLSPFVSTQNHYSLLYRHAEVELMPFLRSRGLSMLAYFPLGGGWLTGTYRPNQPFPEGSRAAKVPTGIVSRMRSERVEHLVPVLESFALERGHTLAELALAWVLAHEEVACALTGFDRPEHVDANAKAVDWKLKEDELSELNSLTSWWDGANAVVDSDGPTPRPKA